MLKFEYLNHLSNETRIPLTILLQHADKLNDEYIFGKKLTDQK